jgi:hypothetical protein
MSQFTLSIDENPIISVPIDFTIQQQGVEKRHKFTLTARRTSHEEQDKVMDSVERKYREALLALDCITGWQGQRLVLDAEKKPADFCQEALEVMLSGPAVAGIIYHSYIKECNAKVKNL